MLDMAVSDVIIACVMERREEDTVAVRQATVAETDKHSRSRVLPASVYFGGV